LLSQLGKGRRKEEREFIRLLPVAEPYFVPGLEGLKREKSLALDIKK